MSLEAAARRHALVAAGRSIVIWTIVWASWFADPTADHILPLGLIVAICAVVATLFVLAMPLGAIADSLLRHVKPTPPSLQFQNVAQEIAIGLGEPAGVIVHDSPIPNVASLPTQKGEAVIATRGALERLERAELEVLIAAQFAGMRDRWCRLATKAEIAEWALRFVLAFYVVALFGGRVLAGVVGVVIGCVLIFAPRWTEQARDLCADVAAVRLTFHPEALAGAMRTLAETPSDTHSVGLGTWRLPTNPFLVVPRRLESTTTIGGKRTFTDADEVRLELLLRADRAEALAGGADPSDYTGREYRRRWSEMGEVATG